jgi:hypothetical protein
MLPAGTSFPTAASSNSLSIRSKPCMGKIIPDARLADQAHRWAARLFSRLLAGASPSQENRADGAAPPAVNGRSEALAATGA